MFQPPKIFEKAQQNLGSAPTYLGSDPKYRPTKKSNIVLMAFV
jgi:hypothetical protein